MCVLSQVEQLYNGLLDRADQLREEMGEITDNVSLRTALETIWNDMAGDARAQRIAPCDHRAMRAHARSQSSTAIVHLLRQ
jgi:hypothetical protein